MLPDVARAMSAPKRLPYPSHPWPYPEGCLTAWPYPAPITAAATVDSETLLFAASLNLSQLVNGPWLVARSGNTSDFLLQQSNYLHAALYRIGRQRCCQRLLGLRGLLGLGGRIRQVVGFELLRHGAIH